MLKHLIDIYESSDDISIDDIFNIHLKNVPEYSQLSKQDIVDLKRRFLDYVRAVEELRNSQDRIKRRPKRSEDDQCQQRYYDILVANSIPQRPNRPHKMYVEAFVNNISVPKTLEELYDYYLDGNDAQNLIVEIDTVGSTEWTVPKWAKWGDIVLFMHAKTARSTLTKLRSEVNTKYDAENNKGVCLKQSIEDQLAFHKKYGGKIYAVGRINGKPDIVEINSGMHFKSKVFCKVDDLFLLEHPIDISEFNSFITISKMSGITPVFGQPFENLKKLISQNNDVPEYFSYSYSTPYPHSIVNDENWMRLGLEYRRAFTLEAQFRQCYVDYLLKRLGDQKTFYMECPCHKGSHPVTYVDNVIRIDKKLLPVEIKLNIEAEVSLESQCQQYCQLDKLTLKKKPVMDAKMENVVDDKVLVIDTFGVYIYHLKDNKIDFLYDLGDLKTEEDIQELRKNIIKELNDSQQNYTGQTSLVSNNPPVQTNIKIQDPEYIQNLLRSHDLANLGVIAPHKKKYYSRYNIDWLIDEVAKGTPLTYLTFWQAGPKAENNIFSQWYQGPPITINGRNYDTAE